MTWEVVATSSCRNCTYHKVADAGVFEQLGFDQTFTQLCLGLAVHQPCRVANVGSVPLPRSPLEMNIHLGLIGVMADLATEQVENIWVYWSTRFVACKKVDEPFDLDDFEIVDFFHVTRLNEPPERFKL